MKKLLAIVLAMILAVSMLSLPVMANGGIDKTLSEEEASLGDHITITLDVDVPSGEEPATVVDNLPDPLKYIAGTLSVGGGAYTVVTASEDQIEITLSDAASYTITFDVQVTSTEAEPFSVENEATVTGYVVLSDSDSEELDIYPYEGFEKWIEDGDVEVPMYIDVYWILGIYVENIAGDDIEDMEGIVVRDRLGGDLELDDVEVSDGSIGSGEIGKSGKFGPTGKTNKEHLAWTGISDMEDDDWAEAYLLISTDVNTGTGNGKKSGQQEYTEAGEHDLNSGAVLKFTDPETGFQLSAHTPPITVVAVEP